MKSARRPTTFVCLLLAAAVVGARLLIFDASWYFGLKAVPNHDMYHAAGIFSASMHCLRSSGDIAWWNPVDCSGGEAQYFNAFFSPLAPTNGHLVFVSWSHLIAGLARLGVAIPEYYQYLVVTFVVLPFLAAWMLAYFLFQVFRGTAAVVLATIAYHFSGIGVWNSAWFYFQEPATMFFLLAAALALLKRPTVARALVLLTAALVQWSSANYWTLHNSIFIAVVLGAYAATHSAQIGRLARRGRRWVVHAPRTSAGLAAAFALSLALWGATLVSAFGEQGTEYWRHGVRGGYSVETTVDRVQEARRYTIELFNPVLSRPLAAIKLINPVHNARYIGAWLIPLLVLFAYLPWRRRERWLALAGISVLAICLAPGILLPLWGAAPFNRLQHFFYFYSHHLQLLAVLLAVAMFDRLLAGVRAPAAGREVARIMAAIIAGCLAVLAGLFVFSEQFALNSPVMQSTLLAVTFVLVSAVLIRQHGVERSRGTLLTLILGINLLAGADLSRYFRECCLADQAFTHKERYLRARGGREIPTPLGDDVRAALARPWTADAANGARSGRIFGNMPVENHFWPVNVFNRHRFAVEYGALPADVRRQIADSDAALAFFEKAQARGQESLFYGAGTPDFRFQTTRWGYNECSYTCTVPRAGWLLVRQIHDPFWRFTLDDRPVETIRANVIATALRVPAGQHRLEMEYLPPSRRLYRWAARDLEVMVVILLAGAAIAARRRRPGQRFAALASAQRGPAAEHGR